MLKLLRFIWTGSWHEHEWEIYDHGKIIRDGGPRATWYDLRCKTCGSMRYRQFGVE